MLDFKLLDIQLGGDYSYLNSLIDHYIQNKKFHLSLVESKKHLDYTVLYIVKKHPEIMEPMSKLYDQHVGTSAPCLYSDYTEQLIYQFQLAVPDLENRWFRDIPRLIEILIVFIFLQIPKCIQIINISPVYKKNNIISRDGMCYLSFVHEMKKYYNSQVQYSSLIYFKTEIRNELHNYGIICNISNDGYIMFQCTYSQSVEKIEQIVNVLNQLGYKFFH